MSQFENPYAGEVMTPIGESKMSAMAVVGLVCSLVLCCPVVTVFGPILGAAALVRIGSNAAIRGRGVAIAAIVIGLATTGLSGAGYYLMFNVAYEMQTAIEEVPERSITAGAAGDFTTFHDGFHTGPGVTLSDDEAAAFFAEFVRRYGEPTSVIVNQQQQASASPMGRPVMPVTYTIYTATGQARAATIEIVIADEVTGELWINKMGQIRIPDSTDGDLVYPPVGAASTAEPAAPSGDADHDHDHADGDHDHDHADGDHDHDHDHDHE